MSQLRTLATPFPDGTVREKPGGHGASYVKHSTYVEKLLATVGPFSFTVDRELRGFVLGKPAIEPCEEWPDGRREVPDMTNCVVGCFGTLEVTIDNVPIKITEIGDCEQPHNWGNDGARLKDAASDAFKRCCMRFGLGLHLYSDEQYRLDEALRRQEEGEGDEG